MQYFFLAASLPFCNSSLQRLNQKAGRGGELKLKSMGED
jgi:hypothetical protein